LLRSEATNVKVVNSRPIEFDVYPKRVPYFITSSRNLKRIEVLQENHRGVSQQVEVVNPRPKGPLLTLLLI